MAVPRRKVAKTVAEAKPPRRILLIVATDRQAYPHCTRASQKKCPADREAFRIWNCSFSPPSRSGFCKSPVANAPCTDNRQPTTDHSLGSRFPAVHVLEHFGGE